MDMYPEFHQVYFFGKSSCCDANQSTLQYMKALEAYHYLSFESFE